MSLESILFICFKQSRDRLSTECMIDSYPSCGCSHLPKMQSTQKQMEQEGTETATPCLSFSICRCKWGYTVGQMKLTTFMWRVLG
jgi:hypothetical protein